MLLLRVLQVRDQDVEAGNPQISGRLVIRLQLVDPFFGDQVELGVLHHFDRVDLRDGDGFLELGESFICIIGESRI